MEGRLLPHATSLGTRWYPGLPSTDKLARRANGMEVCGTAEDEINEIIKKNLEAEKNRYKTRAAVEVLGPPELPLPLSSLPLCCYPKGSRPAL